MIMIDLPFRHDLLQLPIHLLCIYFPKLTLSNGEKISSLAAFVREIFIKQFCPFTHGIDSNNYAEVYHH